tara:strand:+ start:989 stop:1216 length:228 start_codon:yes stop_codon:yes gene_type:complete
MLELIKLNKKLVDAENKLADAQAYSCWSSSIRGFKAAETKASNRLFKSMRKYLGSNDTVQNRIDLMTELNKQAVA